jgi:hypothetical protein
MSDSMDVSGAVSDNNFQLNGDPLIGDENVMTVADMTALMREVLVWVKKLEEIKSSYDTTSGEVRAAYALVYKDFLWKIQRKIGRLWFYVGGAIELNPFDSPSNDQ